MAFKYSTGFRNAVCDTGSIKGTFDGGFIKVYAAGSVPADADAAHGGTLLVTYSVNGDGVTGLALEAAAIDGTITKNLAAAWQGTAVATGTALFFRYERSGDAGGASTTAVRIQGTVGGAGADLFMASTAITAATSYALDYFSLTFMAL